MPYLIRVYEFRNGFNQISIVRLKNLQFILFDLL